MEIRPGPATPAHGSATIAAMTIATELAWWAAQPLDAWQPVGDNSKVGPAKTAGEPKLTAPSKVSRKDYQGGILACLRAYRVAYENREHMTYTEGPDRWSGITEDRRSIKGEYPPTVTARRALRGACGTA